MIYDTGNAVPSVDARDLNDNMIHMEEFSLSELDYAPDRLGVNRMTMQGIRNASQYVDLGPYAAGLVFTSRNQVFSYLGNFYSPGPAITLPYTTTGDGAAEIANFRSVGDAVLRTDLADAVDPVKGAALVGYRGRTIRKRLQDTLSVKDFGAVGDGVANDTAAIQACVNALRAGGGEVYFPPGKYKITNAINITELSVAYGSPRVNIRGAGSTATFIQAYGFAGPALVITGTTGFVANHYHIGGFRLSGNLFAGSSGIDFRLSAYGRFSDVSVEGFAVGVVTQDVEQMLFENMTVRWNTDGMSMLSASSSTDVNSIVFINCNIGNNAASGLQITRANAVTFVGGSIQYNGATGGGAFNFGMKLIDCGTGYGNVMMTGLVFEANGGDADLFLYNQTEPSIITLESCSFARPSASLPYAVANILVSGTATTQIVRSSGTLYRSFGTYVPNSLRRYIVKSNANALITSDRDFFQSPVEAPAAGVVQFTASYVSGSALFDPPSIASGTAVFATIAVTGARLGDFVVPSFSLSLAGLSLTAYVSATDTVTFEFFNASGAGVDLASGTLSAIVFKL